MSTRIDRTERLLNLVICLMASSQPVTRAQIQRQIPGYSESASPAAFERMFERDKDELRSMGVPVETVSDSTGEVLGYRIPQGRYALEDLQLTLAERAAVAVAAQVWGQAVAAPVAGTALRKLEAGPGDPGSWAPAGLRGSVQLTTSDAALLPLMAAIRQDREVSFAYRPPSEAEARERRVAPWALRSTSGNWFLVGHDAERDAVRTFRLSRIVGAVTVSAQGRHAAPPTGFELSAAIESRPGDDARVRATVRCAPGRAASVRRRAVVADEGERWTADVLQVEAPSLDLLTTLVCGAGADAVVIEPPELVAAVRDGLVAVAHAHDIAGRS